MERPRKILSRVSKYYRSKSIQLMIAIAFTAVSVGSMVLVSFLLYSQFTDNLRDTILQENRQLVNQIALNLNRYNSNMRGVADSMYYNVIKNADLAEQDLSGEMNLLYESNELVSIACFDEDGNVVAATPYANL